MQKKLKEVDFFENCDLNVVMFTSFLVSIH